jgi:hypothetical protein
MNLMGEGVIGRRTIISVMVRPQRLGWMEVYSVQIICLSRENDGGKWFKRVSKRGRESIG